jgi:hypothetical protein
LAWAGKIGSKRPANTNRRLFSAILIPRLIEIQPKDSMRP